MIAGGLPLKFVLAAALLTGGPGCGSAPPPPAGPGKQTPADGKPDDAGKVKPPKHEPG